MENSTILQQAPFKCWEEVYDFYEQKKDVSSHALPEWRDFAVSKVSNCGIYWAFSYLLNISPSVLFGDKSPLKRKPSFIFLFWSIHLHNYRITM